MLLTWASTFPRPTASFQFAGATSLDSLITYTGQNGTYFNSSGTLTAATTNVARFDYDPSTLIARGLLIEEARTNLLLQSETIDSASWIKTDTTITANSINAPSGAQTADLATEGSAGTASIQQSYTGTSNTNQVLSVFLKSGNVTWVRIVIFETAAGGNKVSGWFNLSAGTVGSAANAGTGSGAAISIQNVGNGWYRCTLSGAVNNAATALSILISSASADGSLARVSGSTYYPWGGQLENNAAFATSYIGPTVASTVTRAADIASITGANFTSFWNATQGTFVARYALVQPANGGNQFVALATDGTSNNIIGINTISTGFGGASTASGGVFDGNAYSGVALVANTFTNIAFSYSAAGISISKDGGAVVSDNTLTFPTGMTKLNLGSDSAGTNHFGSGWISSLAYYPIRLPDTTLQALSA